MLPIIVCSIGSPSLAVFESSVEAYAPKTPLVVHKVERTTFGESYNKALTTAFVHYDEVLIANDDIVLHPDTLRILEEDIEALKKSNNKLGLVGVRSDNVRLFQNIRYQPEYSNLIRRVSLVSPILAYISKEAFEVSQFPPINYWSDDVICIDLTNAGFEHFISRAYVHHVGSRSIGTDINKFKEEDLPWIVENRPQYINSIGY